jgi:hypothetical protein
VFGLFLELGLGLSRLVYFSFLPLEMTHSSPAWIEIKKESVVRYSEIKIYKLLGLFNNASELNLTHYFISKCSQAYQSRDIQVIGFI